MNNSPLDILAQSVVKLLQSYDDLKKRMEVIESNATVAAPIPPLINYDAKIASLEAELVRTRVDAQVSKKQVENVIMEKVQVLSRKLKDELLSEINKRVNVSNIEPIQDDECVLCIGPNVICE